MGWKKSLFHISAMNFTVFYQNSTNVTSITEKAMATHSSTRAWKIPWTEEPGRLRSMESLKVRHDWATSLLLFTFMHWRRKWQPTPVFLPRESQGWGRLVGCRLWGHTESDNSAAAYGEFCVWNALLDKWVPGSQWFELEWGDWKH